MKLFWKLFCSMVILVSLACSLGGYLLIDQQFHSTLSREVSALYEENDLLRYTLSREIRLWGESLLREDLVSRAHSLDITTGGRSVAFRLADGQGCTLTSAGAFPPLDGSLAAALPEGSRGWELAHAWGDRTFLHAASPLALADGMVYLESCREVTGLFAARQEQYRRFSQLMLGLVAAVGALSMVVSRIMLRPLGRLSAATKRMASGELDVRVRVDSSDELGALSEDFNAMAGRLEEQVQALKDAARRQEDFVGSFAHEIKTPLTSIIGYADLLRSRPLTADQVRESAGYIFGEGRRLEAMSRKLMDMIVLERQDFPLRLVPMDVFLRQTAGALRPALAQQGIQLEVRVEAAKVPLEPDLMETVLLNLLDNARKAMEHGGVIRLEGAGEAGGYVIRVADTGKGIPPEDLGRVTEAFYMVDKSRARAQGGAGLGLALCRRIVDLHGGRMELQSEVGAGTAISVHLKGGEPPCAS